MPLAPPSPRFKALPVQLVETDHGVILKRGCTEIRISGVGAAAAVNTVLAATAGHGATREEVRALFAAPQRPVVDRLIEQLLARRLLVTNSTAGSPPGIETCLDVFYWHFEESAARVAERLNSRALAILGVNCISRQLAAALNATGWESYQVVDVPLLRNLQMFEVDGTVKIHEWGERLLHPLDFEEWKEKTDPQSFDCLVATSDFGGRAILSEWNKFCHTHRRNFLPVVLRNLVGYVGPLVMPGETACFECLLARQNSQFEDYQAQDAIDAAAFEGQRTTGFHPAMASILGDITALELTRHYSGALPVQKLGVLIEVNLLAMKMTGRKVLKIPRCAVCSPLGIRSPVNPKQTASRQARPITTI